MGSPRDKREREGRCRLCARPKQVRRLTSHHLYPVRRRGRAPDGFDLHDERNTVPLCSPCHRAVEKALIFRGERELLAMLRRSLTVEEVDYLQLIPHGWLDRHYPYWLHQAQRDLKRRLAASA